MKFGFNLLLWTPHVTKEHLPILKALKKDAVNRYATQSRVQHRLFPQAV